MQHHPIEDLPANFWHILIEDMVIRILCYVNFIKINKYPPFFQSNILNLDNLQLVSIAMLNACLIV